MGYVDLARVDAGNVELNLRFLDFVPNKAMPESEAPDLLIKRDSSSNCEATTSKGGGSGSLREALRKEVAQLECSSPNPLIKDTPTLNSDKRVPCWPDVEKFREAFQCSLLCFHSPNV